MGYYENDRYDVFIAYYGNKTTGSEAEALALYERIEGASITPDKRIRAYCHPAVNPYGRFEDTPLIVARTPLFLLVVDKNIPTTAEGQLPRHRENGTLSNLFEEVRTFQDSVQYKSIGGDSAVKLFITDDMDFKAAECLHPVFSGRIALSRHEEVLDWITHFYTQIYPNRLFRKYEYMAKEKREEFLQGDWVSEAEEAWRTLKNEHIGRSLMIYYLYHFWQGDRNAGRRLQEMKRQFRSFRNLDPKTVSTLQKIK